MKFALVDRITEIVPGERITAVKAVSQAEEYLADHFPTFPVLPGVLMLESLAEAAAWLIRLSTDFAHSMILLCDAKNVTYKSFLKPGYLLHTEVTCRRLGKDTSDFLGVGYCDQREIVKARFSVRQFNLADNNPALASVDARIIASAKAHLNMLCDAVT